MIKSQEELNQESEESLIHWITFFRRNIHRFVEFYLGINLHFYQKVMLYLMSISPLVVLICARAVSKSFITSLYAVSVCILYPNSKVLVTALTKKQASLLIAEKIEKELMVMSPCLRREISKIVTGANNVEVVFKNGSSFIASVAGEQSRGLRSTILITDEYRLVKKDVYDSVLAPTLIIRPTPYTHKEEYKHLQEEPRQIFLSSAYWKSHWMWNHIKKAVNDMYKDNAIVFGTDYQVCLKHGIRTKNQMLTAKKNTDMLTYEQEYLNIMVGGSENQFYSYDLVASAQKIKRAWYPKTLEEFASSKKTRAWDIAKQKDEIRLVSVDVALSASTKSINNDMTIIKCLRVLPNGENCETQEVYTEGMEGVDTLSQSIRIRQIMEDFEADKLILDSRNIGMSILDEMGKILYDPERDVEYTPIKVFNDERLAERCKNPNAIPMIYGFIATADLNHRMHFIVKDHLTKGKLKTLISHVVCKEQYLINKKEYKNATTEEKVRLEMPYMHSDLTLNEMIVLDTEIISGGKIKLVEPSNGMKDKYITLGMAMIYVDEFEKELTRKNTNSNLDMSQLFQFSRVPKIRAR